MKFYVEKCVSKKSGNSFICLKVDLGYCQKIISFDTNLIMTILDYTPSQMDSLRVGDIINLTKGE